MDGDDVFLYALGIIPLSVETSIRPILLFCMSDSVGTFIEKHCVVYFLLHNAFS